jgi:hypothetical protein
LLFASMILGCGLLGGGKEPDRLSDDLPGPFEQVGPITLCMGGVRLDAPGAIGVAGDEPIGLCVSDASEARRCELDSECADRESCMCGTCRVPVCLINADCPEDTECTGAGHRCQARCLSDEDCPAGELCDPNTLGCTSGCEADTDCSHGEVCSSIRGMCVTVTCTSGGCSAGRSCDVQRRVVSVGHPALAPREAAAQIWLTVPGAGIVRFVPSADGNLAADPSTPVLGEPLMDPAVTAGPGGGFLMIVGEEGGARLHALVGTDGIEWSAPVFGSELLGPEQEWEGGWVGRPSVLQHEDGWVLAWEGGPGAGIGLALLGADGVVTRVGDAPIVDVSNAGSDPWWSGLSAVGSPHLFHQDCTAGWSGVALLFEGRGLEWLGVDPGSGDPPAPNSSIGYARFDGPWSITVDPHNPLFSTNAGIAVTRSEHDPVIVCRPGGFRLHYTASGVESGASEGLFEALSF